MSFPNPGMLPLSEAGGALSGANFGVFYTVLMQVGYKHFAPRVLKQLNDGMALTDALMQVQAELRPFNKRIILDAVDRLPTMLDITAKMLERFIQASASQGSANIAHGIEDIIPGIKDIIEDIFPSLPEAEGHIIPPDEGRDTSGMTLAEHEANKKAERERLAKAKKDRPGQIQAFGSTKITAQVSKGTQKRTANQSAKMERVKLISDIQKQTAIYNNARSKRIGTGTQNQRRAKQAASALRTIKSLQQKLTNLLTRYKF